jgi:hypothetical protein
MKKLLIALMALVFSTNVFAAEISKADYIKEAVAGGMSQDEATAKFDSLDKNKDGKLSDEEQKSE